jgi:hypothetical protein
MVGQIAAVERLMESYMKHGLKGIKENMYGLIECTLIDYARLLRQEKPGCKIRNADVVGSAIPEFANLGFIELVDARIEIPSDLPEFLIETIKRAKPPIWIPGKNFPDNPFDIYDLMVPSLRNNEIVWKYTPPRRPSTWRRRARRNKP